MNIGKKDKKMKKINEKSYDPNAEKKEGPFVTKLKPRGQYKAYVDKFLWNVGEKKDYKNPSQMIPDYKIRVKFRVDGFPEDDPQYVDWFTISPIVPSEAFKISPKATRLQRAKNLYDALNVRDKKDNCKIRAKFGGCEFESQEDCDQLFEMIKNEPLLVILDKHVVKPDGNVYPKILDVDVLEDKESPF